MNRSFATILLAICAVLPCFAEQDTKIDKLPDGVQRFNGMVIGRLVSKDVEKGTFVVTVDAVPRVWRNSKAENPKSLIGKNIEIDGVFGKWLDVLLLVKPGETLECEAKHDAGDRLTFPGELLRKTTPVKPGDYPELPEGFRGFRGLLVAKIVKKDNELMETIVQVEKVKDVWEKNKAKTPKTVEGKKVMLIGFWQRRDQYHGLKVGDRIEVGVQHIQTRSDHINLTEVLRKVSDKNED